MVNEIKGLEYLRKPSNYAPQSLQSKSENVSIFDSNNAKTLEKPENILGDDKKLTKEEKKAIKEAEKAEKKRISNEPDGVIQGGSQGSSAGDCWLLSEMNALSTTSWGKEALSKAITKDENGDYTVKFEGADAQYTISQKEFKSGRNSGYYSQNDADALILELAVEKHFQKENLNNGSIYGNSLAGDDSLQYLLTGNKGRETTDKNAMTAILSEMGKSENKGKIAATYVFYDQTQGSNGVHHALAIKDVTLDDKGEIDKIIVADPYNPKREISKSYSTFMNEATLFGYVLPPKEKAKMV